MKSDKSDNNAICSEPSGSKALSETYFEGTQTSWERESTQRAKGQFLALFERSGGSSISLIVERVGISRDTYYRWLKEDIAFKAKINETRARLNDFVEDMLMMRILKNDGVSIRFYLSRRHPAYQLQRTQTSSVEGKTLEDLMDEAEMDTVE